MSESLIEFVIWIERTSDLGLVPHVYCEVDSPYPTRPDLHWIRENGHIGIARIDWINWFIGKFENKFTGDFKFERIDLGQLDCSITEINRRWKTTSDCIRDLRPEMLVSEI